MSEKRDYLIWSDKWAAWYREDCAGYSADIQGAGLYTREQAEREASGEDYLHAVPVRDRIAHLNAAMLACDERRRQLKALLDLAGAPWIEAAPAVKRSISA